MSRFRQPPGDPWGAPTTPRRGYPRPYPRRPSVYVPERQSPLRRSEPRAPRCPDCGTPASRWHARYCNVCGASLLPEWGVPWTARADPDPAAAEPPAPSASVADEPAVEGRGQDEQPTWPLDAVKAAALLVNTLRAGQTLLALYYEATRKPPELAAVAEPPVPVGESEPAVATEEPVPAIEQEPTIAAEPPVSAVASEPTVESEPAVTDAPPEPVVTDAAPAIEPASAVDLEPAGTAEGPEPVAQSELDIAAEPAEPEQNRRGRPPGRTKYADRTEFFDMIGRGWDRMKIPGTPQPSCEAVAQALKAMAENEPDANVIYLAPETILKGIRHYMGERARWDDYVVLRGRGQREPQ